MRGYKTLLVALIFFAGSGCASIKKGPCEPFSKTIYCAEINDSICESQLNEFLNNFIERFNNHRIKYDRLTVYTENGATCNIKWSIDFNIPTVYADFTYCVDGEVVDKERLNLGGEYR